MKRAVLTLLAWACCAPAFAQDAGVPLVLGGMDAAVPEAAVDVTVRSGQSIDQKRRSAEAVSVVDLTRASQQSADLGEVLARTEGIAIRRGGGLGSDAQISINGLWGQQIRTFIDGVPSQLLYPFDIASVPLQLVRQVEVFRGVVPIRFGTDALGGAINLVPRERGETSGEVSLQAGSFGLFRGTFGAGQQFRNGLYVDGSAFLDRARNDFAMNARAPDASGQQAPVRVTRFHDRYASEGGALELGVRDKPWAKRLSLRGFASASRQEIQHDLRVSVPDGQGQRSNLTGGMVGRYEVSLARDVDLALLAVYSRGRVERTDSDQWNYDWFGRRVSRNNNPSPIDNLFLQNDLYGRAGVAWKVAPGHALRAVTTPSVTFYSGENRALAPGFRDTLAGTQRLLTWISGAEYQLDALASRLENIAAFKVYSYRIDAEETAPPNRWQNTTTTDRAVGWSDSLRFSITRWFYTKASYEYATRMPTQGEVFGDGLFVLRNLKLKPERSHNVNFGPVLDLKHTKVGDLRLEVNGFLRETRDQIVAIPVDNVSYGNLANARSVGVDNALTWSSPGRWVTLNGTTSYVDSRSTSSRGTFSSFEGERIPNRPWLLASWSGYGRWEYRPGARIEPYYYGRYVHSYLLGWANIGRGGEKFEVPTQITHTLGLSHILELGATKITASFEVQNLSDARVYDNFRVPRPGRGYYFRLVASL
ncbi:MAG: TonB-dependent receptor plug domain-containing protein [Polyangiales bacterium]